MTAAESMRDDLLDAYASIEWAEAQLDTFHVRIQTWLHDSPDVARIDMRHHGERHQHARLVGPG